jgi:outer membrane protein OmpA-like peptidoglycan-associated protein
MQLPTKLPTRTARSNLPRHPCTIWALVVFGAAVSAALPAQTPASMSGRTLSYADGQQAKITGFILTRRGDSLLVRDETTRQIALVTFHDGTKIESPSGAFALDHKRQSDSTLIPGLQIEVKGTGGMRGELMADRIKFHQSSLRVANQIAAGQVDLRAMERRTQNMTAANRDSLRAVTRRSRDTLNTLNDRIDSLGNAPDRYSLQSTEIVNFAPGSAMLSDDAKHMLDGLVSQSTNLDATVFEISAYADATGAAEYNKALTMQRAQAIAAYLRSKNVPSRGIAPLTGAGAADFVATNATPGGRAMNRRAVVTMLVNRNPQ